MKLEAPQLIMLFLWVVSLTLAAQDSPMKFLTASVSISIMAGLLWWGGFF